MKLTRGMAVRKPDRAVRISASIPPAFHAWLKSNGYRGSISDGLRRAWDVVQNKC